MYFILFRAADRMVFYLAVILVSVVIVCTSGLGNESHNLKCPPPEEIYPCTCTVETGQVKAICKDITSQRQIQDVFDNNPDWKLQVVQFEECTFQYIPSSIMETANFQSLNLFSSTLVSLFDAAPLKRPSAVLLERVRILRGIQWKFFSKTDLLTLQIVNTVIKTIGKPFKKHVPTSVRYLWLENTKTKKIKHQAFQRLVNLNSLGLVGGSLKKVSRDMFPRPWNIGHINLSRQKLTTLPNDFFADLPNLRFFSARSNYFTVLSDKVFTMAGVLYDFSDNPFNCNCRIKWVTNFLNDANTRFRGKCSQPKSFKGRELTDLTYQDFEYCG